MKKPTENRVCNSFVNRSLQENADTLPVNKLARQMAIDYLNRIFSKGSIPDISLNMHENKEFNDFSDNEINIDTAGNYKQ